MQIQILTKDQARLFLTHYWDDSGAMKSAINFIWIFSEHLFWRITWCFLFHVICIFLWLCISCNGFFDWDLKCVLYVSALVEFTFLCFRLLNGIYGWLTSLSSFESKGIEGRQILIDLSIAVCSLSKCRCEASVIQLKYAKSAAANTYGEGIGICLCIQEWLTLAHAKSLHNCVDADEVAL